MKAFIRNIIFLWVKEIPIDQGVAYMIKYVIFDMDGTLLDTEPIYEWSWNEIGRRWGLNDVGDMYAELVCGRTVESSKSALKERYGRDFNADGFITERMALYSELAKTDLRLKSGCMEILAFLKEQSIPCAVATSTVSELAYSNLDRMNIRHMFEAVVTGSMVKNGKPAPDIFIEAGRSIGATPNECIVCEDSYSGVIAAHGAGMLPIFIPDRQKPTEETDAIAFATFGSLFDVIALIKKENNI